MTLVVAAAIVGGQPAQLLAAQRAYPADLAGRWELPGGKVDDGEDELTALVRECREELGVVVRPLGRVGADVPTVDGAATLRVWWAAIEREPQAREHAQLRWLAQHELGDVTWLDADLPVIDAIRAAWPGPTT